MTDDRNLYYELSLSNRQVLVAIVLLLGCVAGAFLSGAWVGRQSRIEEVSVASLGQTGDELNESFEFFAEPPAGKASPPRSQESGAAASESRTPAQPPSREAMENRQAVRPAPVSEPGESRPADAAPAVEKPPPRTRSEPAVADVPADSSSERSARPDRAPAAQSAETPARDDQEPLVIQVFSSADEEQARAVLERLRRGGLKAFLAPIETGGRTMYRVRVGPFNERALAQVEADRLKREYRLDTWITQASN